MSTTTEPSTEPRLHTIGAVCERLRVEFPDVSISKIRYLEDQGLLRPTTDPWRVPPLLGGGRRAARDDPASPARRVPAAARDPRCARDAHAPARRSDAGRSSGTPGGEIDQAGFCERAGITPDFARRLEEYDLVTPRIEAGERIYRESDVEIAAACGRLSHHGLDARHLRAFRTAAGRQSALLEQLVAAGLRSRDPQRRRAALDDLQTLAGVAIELAQHLLVRDLREASER